jgi:hypothetical protein
VRLFLGAFGGFGVHIYKKFLGFVVNIFLGISYQKAIPAWLEFDRKFLGKY